METETIRSEEDAQKAYEDYVKDTNSSIEEKNRDIVHKSMTKAKAEADLVQAKDDHEAVLLELEQLGNYKSASTCRPRCWLAAPRSLAALRRAVLPPRHT